MAESEEELKSLLMKVKKESEKVGFKLSIQKTKIMASGPILHHRWENNGNSERLYFSRAPKSLQMVTEARKLKDTCSLGKKSLTNLSSVQFSSVSQLCLTLCDPIDCSTPSLPVHHQLPEFTQTHVHWVGDAIQPSHPLSSPSPPTFTLSQHQSLFKWVSSLHQVAKVLEFQLQH